MEFCSPFEYYCFVFYGYGVHRDLHVLTHSVPPRRSSDLARGDEAAGHRVEDVGYGAAGEAVVGKRPAIGLVLIGTVTVKLHFLKKISAGAGFMRLAAFGKVGQVGHGVDRKSTRLNSSH